MNGRFREENFLRYVYLQTQETKVEQRQFEKTLHTLHLYTRIYANVRKRSRTSNYDNLAQTSVQLEEMIRDFVGVLHKEARGQLTDWAPPSLSLLTTKKAPRQRKKKPE